MPNLQYVAADDKFYRAKVRLTKIHRDGEIFIDETYIGPYTNTGTLKGQITRERKQVQRHWCVGSDVEVISIEVADEWKEIEL